MGRAPLILVVADRKSATTGAWVDVPTDGLPHSYLAAVEAAGGAPLVVPSLAVHADDPGRLLDLADGVFLPGGRDVHADAYGQDAHPDNDEPLPLRDALEIALIVSAHERHLPVLGACRGMQLINVALGGTLEQHLADRLDMAPHRGDVGTFASHDVVIREDSRLASVLPRRSFSIASHHHQAVDQLGMGLTASAWAPDGVVEAIETTSGPFCLGVQWHPEQQLAPEGLALFSAFVGEARAAATRRRAAATEDRRERVAHV
ncbi:gamma-glutamyl-gamma-aminobutyrate hydrolase family protein [Georgenia sp. AZ-5]|uniref:gamma-glutamyl-gamma-aminobutyrate hydrolase family protein n=1 Tax=Georgenia sp. AZ-5 TaxID=3367526 RepID=UPI0037553B05